MQHFKSLAPNQTHSIRRVTHLLSPSSHPHPLQPLSPSGLLFQASPFQHEGGKKGVLVRRGSQAVETCTWQKSASQLPACHNGVMFTKWRVQDGGASSLEKWGLVRSPIQLSQSSIESASVKRSGVKSSKMDLFLLL